MQNLIILEDEGTWPVQVIDYLSNHHDFFLNWELGNATKVSGHEYDRAFYGLQDILRTTDYVLRGYHCTRLTDHEIHSILANGMQLPNRNILYERINLIEKAGLIDSQISDKLKSDNQADDANRAGILWFCFFPPYYAGQFGIERFFRSWGGEALYNSHENDPVSGRALNAIGTPCIIEAYVLIKTLNINSYLESKLIHRFLVNRGIKAVEIMQHEDYVVEAIPSPNIKKIIKFPECDFCSLTECDTWNPKLV